MARHAARVLVACVLMALTCAVTAQTTVAPSGNAEVAALLERISITASNEQRRQIVDAMTAAPSLLQRLGALASKGALTEIDVVEPKATSARAGVPSRPSIRSGARMPLRATDRASSCPRSC
jgi:hypothetical protein